MSARKNPGYTQVLREPNSGRIIRYRRDCVGNDLTAVLLWCANHHEPVWKYGDGSAYSCAANVGPEDDGTHDIVNPPWEVDR